ncbi:low affinity immunoglobulin gamma Fc region receptor III-like protein [Lates japonicus]|nr:low affinity immunoglobulin gamma Fc region receptor III-like protein [Lates japonicus]
MKDASLRCLLLLILSARLTVSPSSSQMFVGESVSLSCEEDDSSAVLILSARLTVSPNPALRCWSLSLSCEEGGNSAGWAVEEDNQ